jgi:altronate dehydratase
LNQDQTQPPAVAQTGARLHQIHHLDNVAVALTDLAALSEVSVAGSCLLLRGDVPFGHKAALVDIRLGRPVIKYGEQIGIATRDIAAGEHVHIHNVESTRGRGDLAPACDHAII